MLLTVSVKVPDHLPAGDGRRRAVKHVSCEWRSAATPIEAVRILDAAKRRGIRMAVGLAGSDVRPGINYAKDSGRRLLMSAGVLTATLSACAPNWGATIDRSPRLTVQMARI